MKKTMKRTADRTLGVPMRTLVRNGIVNPLMRLNYSVTIIGDEHALSCTEGAIVVANHVSYLDGPFLMNEAWPFARIWATAWWKEYRKHRFFMWLFSVVSLGSPSELPRDERTRRKEKTMAILNRILRAGRHLLVFAEGGIGDGKTVHVKPHLTGVHDLIRDNPDKPVLMVRIEGLQYSAFGKMHNPSKRRFLRRLPVTITLERFDNVALHGGPPGINGRIERYFNDRVPLAVDAAKGASAETQVLQSS